MDNLSTHTTAALYAAFSPDEARRVARRLEIHDTPKHASWLNMVEIEIGVMVQQCLARRIPERRSSSPRSPDGKPGAMRRAARIKWLFTVERARQKLGRSYPIQASAAAEPAERNHSEPQWRGTSRVAVHLAATA